MIVIIWKPSGGHQANEPYLLQSGSNIIMHWKNSTMSTSRMNRMSPVRWASRWRWLMNMIEN